MTLRELEQKIATMSGGQLLDELVTFAALHLDAHNNDQEDHPEVIVRAFQVRLAETGVAKKHHREVCRFPLGDDYCPCSSAHWSWPRQGMPGL